MTRDLDPRQSRSVKLAEVLAKKWMTGFRESKPRAPRRFAWEHPEDLVTLLAGRPGEFSHAGMIHAMSIAWLHDVLEDGRKPNGARVTVDDLMPYVIRIDDPLKTPIGAALSPSVIEGVVELTHQEGQSKIDYYKTLPEIGYQSQLVKCVDRICNLREGAANFKNERWARYVRETRTYILPLTESFLDPTASWLREHLTHAMAVRPVE